MTSTLRFTTAAGALAIALLTPAPSNAQQLSEQVSASVTVRVQPMVAIRSVTPARTESRGTLSSAVVVSVASNLPYRLTVRLAAPASRSAGRVLVRNASGAFEPLTPGGSITTVVSSTGAQRGHEVVCRVESASRELLDPSRCSLTYELSAEHDGVLLRATASNGARAAN